MREILFRAKAINRIDGHEYRTKYKNGDWVFGLLSKPYHDVNGYIQPAEMRNTDGVDGIEVDHETLGQYTGLTDKNGVKIFEGDIFDREIDDGKTKRYIVEWSRNYLGLVAKEIRGKPRSPEWVRTRLDILTREDLEVIGNAYDTPELLGGDDHAAD